MTVELQKNNIISHSYLDFIIDSINDYIDTMGLSNDPINFYFEDKEVLYASDLETVKSKMSELNENVTWSYNLVKGRPLRTIHIQEIVDNFQKYFCDLPYYCLKQNDENDDMLWIDFMKGNNNIINAGIYFDTFLERARWYTYNNGPKISIKPQYETIIESVEVGKDLYVEGIGEKTLKVDLLFMIDDSGSMSDDIDRVKSSIVKMNNYLVDKGFDIRFAFCKYVDKSYSNEIDFTYDVSYLEDNIETDVYGGKEPSLNALMNAVNQDDEYGGGFTFSWREDVNKIVLLCTDESSDSDTFTPSEVGEYYNNNNYRLIYSAEYPRTYYSGGVYDWEDIVPEFNNAIHTDLLRSNTWKEIVNWISQLIETETYICDVTVPDLTCLDNILPLEISDCTQTTDLCMDISDINEDVPQNEDICSENEDEN